MAPNLWLPGAEKIPGRHSAGLPMLGGAGHYATHHITVSGKGSYDPIKGVLLREGFEPTIQADPVLGKFGQFLPANRGAYALEHNGPPTNTAGSIHVQIEWVWPAMAEDITKAPHFAEMWRELVEWCDQLGIPRAWPFGFKSTAKTLAKWQTSGHRGHVNAPGNSHSDNLPAPTAPAWPVAPRRPGPMADEAMAAIALLTPRLNRRKQPYDAATRTKLRDLRAAINVALTR